VDSLADLRAACSLSQRDLGQRLGMTQSEVSRLERRPDLRLSTLRRYVGALGGHLRLIVRRADGPEVDLRVGPDEAPRAGHLTPHRRSRRPGEEYDLPERMRPTPPPDRPDRE
jgi:transcriptional regulator with XRE-family HTH domain